MRLLHSLVSSADLWKLRTGDVRLKNSKCDHGEECCQQHGRQHNKSILNEIKADKQFASTTGKTRPARVRRERKMVKRMDQEEYPESWIQSLYTCYGSIPVPNGYSSSRYERYRVQGLKEY